MPSRRKSTRKGTTTITTSTTLSDYNINQSTISSRQGSHQSQLYSHSSKNYDDDSNSVATEEEEEEEDNNNNTMDILGIKNSASKNNQEVLPLLDNCSDYNDGYFHSDCSTSGTEQQQQQHQRSRLPLDSPGSAAAALPNNETNIALDAPIIHVIDRIEDEVEAHAYEDLVPLEIKLALEDKVFGWSHLTSAFLGHITYTIGSYCLVNELLKLLWYILHGSSPMPQYFFVLRVALSLWAAVNAYRFVRRRRQVWFRSAYGTKAYKQDEARRRQTVQEADRSTAIGRMIGRFHHRRTLKKLRKAEKMFAKRHHAMKQKMEEMQQQQQQYQEEEVTVLSRSLPIPFIERQGSADESCCSGSESEKSTDSGNTSYESTNTADTTATATSTTASCSSPEVTPLRHSRRRPSFHTFPVNRMQSYAHDQVLFPTINNMPYAHGGFFGAAPFLLANPHWISILRHLMPDVYVEISRRVAHSPASKLIHWAENNPVVAAYGAAHQLEYFSSNNNSQIPNLEWDVFLDPILVRRVQIVLDARDKYLATHSKSSPQAKPILKYYKTELRKRSQALVDKMLIAHGNLTQLFTEQLGWAKHYNYSRVKRTRQTLGGGIYARQWMAVFAEALKLGVVGMEVTAEEETLAPPVSSKTRSLLALADSKCPETSMAQSTKIVESIMKCKEPFGLVLDIKSRHVPKRIWSIVVDTLRKSGIRIEGIASFSTDEIRGVSRWCEQPVKEIIFFHSAGDLQKACHEGRIHRGDTVFLNGGSLVSETRGPDFLTRVTNFDPQEIKRSYRIHPFGQARPENQVQYAYPTIQYYKEYFQLSIGLYCQEFAIDEAAIQLLALHVNQNANLFDLGLAWGGVNGITIQGISPGRFTSTDGFWNQRYIGEMWDYNLPLLQLPPSLSNNTANTNTTTTANTNTTTANTTSTSTPPTTNTSSTLLSRTTSTTSMT